MLQYEYKIDKYGKEILLQDNKYQVMMEWEKPYMESIIDEIKPTGDVLEIGFGCGYSATAIQKYNPKSHTIIECHDVVIDKLKDWSKKYNNINIIEGYWQQQLHKLGDFDFIFFDDHPLEIFGKINKENKFQFSLQNNRFNMFVDICLDWHMKTGSILSAYMNESETKYKDEHFNKNIINNPKIRYGEKIIDVEVPSNCKYYRGGDKAVIPLIKKIS
tara:strand:+ start:42 stop:692 length:651 start_codon:yes stop_codon:yes gene_type:complete